MLLLLLQLACSGSDGASSPEAARGPVPTPGPVPPAPEGPPLPGSGPQGPPLPGSGPEGSPLPGRPPAAAPVVAADASTFTVRGTGGPNILWISLDTVSALHLEPWGGPVRLPSVEQLGAVRVTRAISNFPQTALSHWSMFTGVLPEVHGDVPAAWDSRYAGPTFAELARARGYATGAFIGGITLRDAETGLSRGFTRYDDAVDGASGERAAEQVAQSAMSWLGEQQGPWFAFVHFFDAHFPYTPRDPKRYDPDYTGTVDTNDERIRRWRDHGEAPPARELAHVQALYDAEIAEMDPVLARLFGALHGDEIVVITADHGESFGHGYYFNHRDALWEEVVHVPLWVKAPGLAAGTADGVVGLVDLSPTVSELAGWTVQAPWQGKSRAALLRGAPEPRDHAAWSRTNPWGSEPGVGPPQFAASTATTKVIRQESGVACRYDLVADPGERAGDCTVNADGELRTYQAAVDTMERYTRAPRSGGPGAGGAAEGGTPAELLELLGYSEPRPALPGPPRPPSPPGAPPVDPPR